MKIRRYVLAITSLFLVQSFAFADRILNEAEIQQVFESLTRRPRKTWIPAGTIRATHYEYKSSSGYLTESTVVLKYDGDRFYWEINVDSHTKQTDAPPNVKSSQDNLDLDWNRRRIFAWDGERYTIYFGPGNHAIVHERPSDIPVAVNGPLTAGIIPWGYGVYTLQSLRTADSSARIDGEGRVHLTINRTNALQMAFVLDAEKDYAVLSCSLNYPGGPSVTKTYDDYETVSGNWIPTTIVIQRQDNSKQPVGLLSYDYWNLTSITPRVPHPDSFRVPYETDALVEFYSSMGDKPLWYRHYSEVDTDSLLQDKLEMLSAQDEQAGNCATVAMKYVSQKLGGNVTDPELAELASGPNKSTSLYALRQSARELGFHCLAVKIDIPTLKSLKDCQVILHLPAANHYVVLEYIDDEYVWLIDLDSNRFFYRMKLGRFALNWDAGTALLVSDKPLDLETAYTGINDDELHKITGSTEGGFSNFSCTDLLQKGDLYLYCPLPVDGFCGGRYWEFLERYGCEPNSDGSDECTGTDMPGSTWSPCVIKEPGNPPVCGITGEWFTEHIRACLP